MIEALTLVSDFEQMYNAKWGYIWGQSGAIWTQAKQDAATQEMIVKYGKKWVGHPVADCSGAFVAAYRKHGLSIYNGSNRIARVYVKALLPISAAKPGMAAFKIHKPGEKGYTLPDEYRQGKARYNGDLNDYYHIGLVARDARYVLNSQSVQNGFVMSKITQNWHFVAELTDVVYDEGGMPMEALYHALVTVPAGTSTVNLRSAASTSSKLITTVKAGTDVAVLAEVNDKWVQIDTGTKQGYVQRQYLQKIGENTTLTEQVTAIRALLAEVRGQLDSADAQLARLL